MACSRARLPATAQAARDGAPPSGLLILTLAMLTAFAPFATDMYLPALPALGRELAASAASQQATLSVFFTGLAVGQLFYGPLIDRFGRRRPLIVGVSVFVLASLGATLAQNIDTLIGLRLLQALGGCAGMIVARAVIRDLFDETETARVLSLMMMIVGLAPVLEFKRRHRSGSDSDDVVLDLRVSRDFGGWELRVDGTNLLDSEYQEIAGVDMPGAAVAISVALGAR